MPEYFSQKNNQGKPHPSSKKAQQECQRSLQNPRHLKGPHRINTPQHSVPNPDFSAPFLPRQRGGEEGGAKEGTTRKVTSLALTDAAE